VGHTGGGTECSKCSIEANRTGEAFIKKVFFGFKLFLKVRFLGYYVLR